MERRDFLKGMIVAAAAPAIVKAENIMRIATPREVRIVAQESISFEEFKRRMVQSIVDQMGLPYESLAVDFARTSFGLIFPNEPDRTLASAKALRYDSKEFSTIS